MNYLITPASSVASSPSASGSPSPSTAEHIKRPSNAFMLYRNSKLCENLKNATNREDVRSCVAGATWRSMPADAQKPFWDAADAARREHRRRYPDYKFSPAKKRTGKAKAPKTASKVSDEEITRIRKQYTNVKGFVPPPSRKAKKARAVKANTRAVGESASTGAFVPVAEVARTPTAFAVSTPQAPLSWPAGPLCFENHAPMGADYGAGPFPYTQAMVRFFLFRQVIPHTDRPSQLNAQHQYGIEPTFGNESHCNNAMLDSIPAIPLSYPVAQSAPFYNEQQHSYNFGSAFNIGSDTSSGMPSPSSSYDMGSGLSSGTHSPASSYDLPSPASSYDMGSGSSSGMHSLAGSYDMHSPVGSYDMGSPSSAGIPSPSSSTFDYSSIITSPSNSVPCGATEDLPKMGAEIGYEDLIATYFAQFFPNAILYDDAHHAAPQGAV